MRRRSWFVVIAITLVLGGSVACGGDPSNATATPTVTVGGTAVDTAQATAAPSTVILPSSGQQEVAQPSGSPSLSSSLPGASSLAVAELRAAVAKVDGQDLVFLLGDGIASAEGRYRAATGACALTRVVDGQRIEATIIGTDIYLGGVIPSGATMRVAVDQLPVGHPLLPLAVPLATFRLLGGVTRAESSTNTYTGRIDLAKVDPGPSQTMARFVAYLVRQAGDRAGDLPFTATVDGFGRLAGFRAVFPRADGGHDLEYEFAIKDVGGGVAVAGPTGTISDAPVTFYAP